MMEGIVLFLFLSLKKTKTSAQDGFLLMTSFKAHI